MCEGEREQSAEGSLEESSILNWFMPGVWASVCVCVCVCVCLRVYVRVCFCVHWSVYSLGSLAAWDGSDSFQTALALLPLSFLTTPQPLRPFLSPAGGAPAVPMMKEEGLLSRRRFSTCGGTSSLRPPHPDGRKLIRNASFGGYNELSPISLPGGCVRVSRFCRSPCLELWLVDPIVLPCDWLVCLW